MPHSTVKLKTNF